MPDVTVKWLGNLRHEIQAGRHRVLVDEPVANGGEDAGPDPYDYLLGALGACTSMTLQMYAKRKGWRIDALEVSLSHGKIHAEDCERCETQTGKVDRITRDIRVRGNITLEQLERLGEIANRCPVHMTLTSETLILDKIGDFDGDTGLTGQRAGTLEKPVGRSV